MYGMFNLFDRIRNYFAFTAEEIKSLFIAIMLLTFIVGFNDGADTFQLSHWLFNYFNCLLIVALSVLARETFQRISAIHTGHLIEFRLWGAGLGIGIALTVLSGGMIPLMLYGGFVMTYLPRQRLGAFRYGLSFNNMAVVALSGTVANLVLAFFFKMFMTYPNPLLQKAILINIIMAALNILPIPPLGGSMILFASRSWYVFSLILVVAAAVLIMAVNSALVVAIGSLLLAGIGAIIWEIYAELK